MVSIIVPIYNAESYLNKCINSLIMQTYSEIEIILINDGSTDNSESICKDFVNRDKRIRYFYQDNQGPSQARNLGLSNILGDYLIYVDADDWLEINAIEEMLKCQIKRDADLCIFGMRKVYEDKNEEVRPYFQETEIDKEDYLKGIIENDEIYGGGYIASKLWKVSSIKKNNMFMSFDVDLKAYEDKAWIIENVLLVNKIELFPYIVYNYRIIMGSLSHNCTIDKIENCILAYGKMGAVIQQYNNKLLSECISEKWYYLLLRYLKLTRLRCKKHYRKLLLDNKEIITCNKNKKITTKIKVYIICLVLKVMEDFEYER